jgi:hypothetical protein
MIELQTKETKLGSENKNCTHTRHNGKVHILTAATVSNEQKLHNGERRRSSHRERRIIAIVPSPYKRKQREGRERDEAEHQQFRTESCEREEITVAWASNR